jgi:hypothetical protein
MMRVYDGSNGAQGLVELASGIDALYLSGRAALGAAFLERLAAARGKAESSGGSDSVSIGGVEFEVASHGMGRYRYCLSHRYGQVGVSPSTHLPGLRVQPRTEFLHGLGVREACSWFMAVLGEEVGACVFTVSRLDLYADVQGWCPTGDDRHRFVCRGRTLETYEDGGELTGFSFGRRKTGTITARIYEKTRDAEHKGADFWADVWGEALDPAQPVFRVEFELARTVLREYGMSTLEEVLAAVPALWSSVTSEWLTYRSPTGDQTRARWPVAPEWQAVQRARLGEGAFGVERMYDGRTRGSVRRLIGPLSGWVAHYGALVGTDGIAATCEQLALSLRDWEIASRRSFPDRIAEWRAKEAARHG